MDQTTILAIVGFVLFACAILAHTLPIACERGIPEWEDTAAAAAAPVVAVVTPDPADGATASVDDGATLPNGSAAGEDDQL